MRRHTAAALIAIAVVSLTACGATDTGSSASSPDTSEESAFDADAYAADAEAALVDGLGGRTPSEACDVADITWHCLYDGITADGETWLRVQMSAPGSGVDIDALSEAARLQVFNLIGETFPDVGMLTTMVDGRDTGTTQRANVPLLNR